MRRLRATMERSFVVFRATFEKTCASAVDDTPHQRSVKPKTRARDVLSAAIIGLIAARLIVSVLGLDVRSAQEPMPLVIHATLIESETASR